MHRNYSKFEDVFSTWHANFPNNSQKTSKNPISFIKSGRIITQEAFPILFTSKTFESNYYFQNSHGP